MPEQFIEIEVERREVIGKQARKHAAKRGMIPGVVYGGSGARAHRRGFQAYHSDSAFRKGPELGPALFLKGTDQQRHVMVKDIQIDPLTNTLIHADFKRVAMDKKIRVKVPIVFEGVAFGVKTQGGMVDMIMREVGKWSVSPRLSPIVSTWTHPLKIGDHVKVGDLKAPRESESP